MSMTTAAVLGTGAWGTTFAQVLADAGVSVTMWGRNADTISFINGGENPTYLPGIALSERISATTDIAEAVAGCELVVVAVPVKAVRATLSAARESFAPDVALLSLAKGLELGSLKRVDEIIAEASGAPSDRIAVLSGPNLSREIAERQPTATVVAATDVELAKEIAKAAWAPRSAPIPRPSRACPASATLLPPAPRDCRVTSPSATAWAPAWDWPRPSLCPRASSRASRRHRRSFRSPRPWASTCRLRAPSSRSSRGARASRTWAACCWLAHRRWTAGRSSWSKRRARGHRTPPAR